METMTLKSGKYWIGDPCYVIKDWQKVLDDTEYFEKSCPYNGHEYFADSTKYGDGVYFDTTTKLECGVDSGTISCLPVEMIDKIVNDINELGNVVEFENDFECSCYNGTFTFGEYKIVTEDIEDDDDDDWISEYDDEYDEWEANCDEWDN